MKVIFDRIRDMLSIKIAAKRVLKNIGDSTLYLMDRNSKLPRELNRIVFVCKGNICRSAFAEYLMNSKTKRKPMIVDSCGLNVETKSPPPTEALKAAKMFGLNLEGHLSKRLEDCCIEDADLIFAMEYWQYKKLVQLFPDKQSSIRLLRDISPFPANLLCNIYDPYGHCDSEFRRCFMQIEAAIDNLVRKI